MGLYVFRLPDVGEGVTEAELIAWHVKPGERIAEDQPLADLMTDKATVEMTSPVAGSVLKLHGAVGDRIAVGSSLVEFDVGETSAPGAGPPSVGPKGNEIAAAGASISVIENASAASSARQPPNHAPLAAPATRRRAQELRIALEDVSGTGPGGRITPEDLERHAGATCPRPARDPGPTAHPAIQERKLIGLRRIIAARMIESSRNIPHFSYVEEFDMTELQALRARLNEEKGADQPKLTLLPFLIRALTVLRPTFPFINALYDGEAGILRQHEALHVGIATQTDDGLMVPVIRHAECRDVWDCARELSRVTTAARLGKASRDELTGSTITLTSLGALGGIAATPIINAPEVAIIGPNKLVDRPVVRNGQIVIRTLMNLSASFDHRIVDGYDAARFVQGLKRLLEWPSLLFMSGAAPQPSG